MRPKTEVSCHIMNQVSHYKRPLRQFLRRNPYPQPRTMGLFFREKMRAIHRIAPDEPLQRILEVGGGRGGVTTLLYPRASVINLDLEREVSGAACNRSKQVRFVCGNAACLPFPNESFDAVTLFDVLEHVSEDGKAASEALRVLKEGGVLLISSPNRTWKYPYHGFAKSICPSEPEIMNRWGHLRRGYALSDLAALTGLSCEAWTRFINAWTAVGHDIAFARLPFVLRWLLCAAVSPLSWTGYVFHPPQGPGTETASRWRKPAVPGSIPAGSKSGRA
jgi:SAM-dependent methyltransferase